MMAEEEGVSEEELEALMAERIREHPEEIIGFLMHVCDPSKSGEKIAPYEGREFRLGNTNPFDEWIIKKCVSRSVYAQHMGIEYPEPLAEALTILNLSCSRFGTLLKWAKTTRTEVSAEKEKKKPWSFR